MNLCAVLADSSGQQLAAEPAGKTFGTPSHDRVMIPTEEWLGDRPQKVHPWFRVLDPPIVFDPRSGFGFGKELPESAALQFSKRTRFDNLHFFRPYEFRIEGQLVRQDAFPSPSLSAISLRAGNNVGRSRKTDTAVFILVVGKCQSSKLDQLPQIFVVKHR